jgi:hypothetical protein
MKVMAIDANLLLLLVVGRTSREFVGRHKRLKGYSATDFDLLVAVLAGAGPLVTTPHTLTEVSNLAGFGVFEPLRTKISETLGSFIADLDERNCPSREVVAVPEFNRLGLSDCAWLRILGADTELLTSDLDLYLAALGRGLSATNFSHLREMSTLR